MSEHWVFPPTELTERRHVERPGSDPEHLTTTKVCVVSLGWSCQCACGEMFTSRSRQRAIEAGIGHVRAARAKAA